MTAALRIDVQHHILPPRYVAALGERAIADLIVSGRLPDWLPQVSVDAMDRNGIEMAVTSISAPAFSGCDRGAARALARECNEYAAALCSDYPGRFGMLANLPMPDVEGSLAELAYCLDELGADGVCLMTSYDGKYPGDEEFRELFEELDRRSVVVHFHPVATPGPSCLAGIPAATLDFPFDTTRAAVNLLFSGALARYHGVRIVLAHAGGTIPFLYERIARLERRPQFRSAVPNGARAELERLYFDTALSATGNVFASLRTLVGMEKVLFASDFPFAGEDTMAATVHGVGHAGLSADELDLVSRENALRLMPTLATKLARKNWNAEAAQVKSG